MMTQLIFDLGLALWLGILTSISPCPLATNIAAVSFIGRQANESRKMFLGGIAYTLGRMTTYILLGIVLVKSLHLIPDVSMFLQYRFHPFIGPFLIITGVFLLGVMPMNFGGTFLSHQGQVRLAKGGLWGAFLLGLVFALAFCPISAALFFGSTLGLAAKYQSGIFLPSVYGIGTSLPVIGFAWVVAFSARTLGQSFNRVQAAEKWLRRISGLVFIGAGVYSLF